MEEPIRKSLSKIELKIIKNTFLSNSNDLRYKDDTRKSLQTLTSKNSNSILPRTIDLSEISQISSSVSNHFRIFSIQELDLSCLTSQISLETLENLSETIKTSIGGTQITLPGKKLSFRSLLITSPIHLKGSAGTLLELLDGSITVDFSSQSRESLLETEKAIICEAAISLKSSRLMLSLFSIESPSTHLEVRDCDLKSDSSSPGDLFAFGVNLSGFRKGASRSSSRFNSSLMVSSCNIQGFGDVCRAGPNSSVIFEKCYICACEGNAISVMNPRDFQVKNCVIDKAEKSGIDVFIAVDNSSVLNSPSSKTDTMMSSQSERTVNIEGNDIRTSGNYGISIWSEAPAFFPAFISVKSNKITNSKKEGLAFRHLNLVSLEIDGNDSNCNQGTGFWLQKVIASKIVFCHNRAYDNYSGYGLYFYDTGGEVKNNEFFRNSLGGLMVVGSSKGTDTNLAIKKNQIHSNGENGITVMDFCKGMILIQKCNVSENSQDGVHLLQTNPDKNSALVKILDSEITGNSMVGLNVVKFRCWIEKLRIADNLNGNIVISEDSKELVRFLDQNEKKVEKSEKKGFCAKNKCVVF
jgi:hypothetical protein